jgi:hydrogenase maturation protease
LIQGGFCRHFQWLRIVHQIGILEVVHLSELIGEAPETTIIGVEPKSLDMGMELLPEVQAKVSRIIELVLEEVNRPAPSDRPKNLS